MNAEETSDSSSFSDTTTNMLAVTPVEAKNLLDHVFLPPNDIDSNTNGGVNKNQQQEQQRPRTKISGRQVLIPFGSRAFLEGELRPETTITRRKKPPPKKDTSIETKPVESIISSTVGGKSKCVEQDDGNGNKEEEEDQEEQEEEMVEVLVQQQNNRNKVGTNPTAVVWKTMSVHDVVEELQALVSKQKLLEEEIKMNQKGKKGGGGILKNQKTKNKTAASNEPAYLEGLPKTNLIDIQEEYDSSGRQIYGQAVDVTSRLQSLWNSSSSNSNSNSNSSNKQNEFETSGEEKDELSGNTATEDSVEATNNSAAATAAANTADKEVPEVAEKRKVIVSDEEYDRLSKRLEELARLEEQEEESMKAKKMQYQQRDDPLLESSRSSSVQSQSQTQTQTLKSNKSNPSPPTASRKSNNATTTMKKSDGGLKFKKGFLNSSSGSSNNNNKKNKPESGIGAKSNNEVTSSSKDGKMKKKITIDTTKNTVTEIPHQVSNPQVIPTKEHASNKLQQFSGMDHNQKLQQQQQQQAPLQQQQQQQQQQFLDSKIFNGQVQEHLHQPMDLPARTQVQPQPQQQQQQQSKEKRMSRFARERLRRQQP